MCVCGDPQAAVCERSQDDYMVVSCGDRGSGKPGHQSSAKGGAQGREGQGREREGNVGNDDAAKRGQRKAKGRKGARSSICLSADP